MPKQFTDDEMRQRIALQKKALEITCYVCGAGAFSVFIRWLQTMLAFNEDGLVDSSIFNVLVPLMVIIAGTSFCALSIASVPTAGSCRTIFTLPFITPASSTPLYAGLSA